MNICVVGIESAECFGSVTVVTEEWCVLVADPDVKLVGYHVVSLRGRSPPSFQTTKDYNEGAAGHVPVALLCP